MSERQLLRSIRIWLVVFIVGLVLSGLTAFPLEHEADWLSQIVATYPFLPQSLNLWIFQVHYAIHQNSIDFPFLAYGTDWLAFAHLVLATAFLGPLVNPVRNKWVLQFGLIACLGVLPLALIAGPLRGIPLLWRFIDCSFGVIGSIPLLICLNRVRRLEAVEHTR